MAETKTGRYELVVLFRPELEAKIDDALKTISDIVTTNGGEIVKTNNWGRREMAYKIAGETHAIYYVYELSLPATAPAKIEATLNITEGVIRQLLTKIDEKAEAVLAAEKKAREAREAARAQQDAE